MRDFKRNRKFDNPFDKLTEDEKMPNPGFYCKKFIDTHNWLPEYWPKHLCVNQCDECLNKVIDHHKSETP